MNKLQLRMWAETQPDPVDAVEQVLKRGAHTNRHRGMFPSTNEIKELLDELIVEEILLKQRAEIRDT